MHLLLIEDSGRARCSLGAGLRRAGYTVTTAQGGREGLASALERGFDAVILDLTRPETAGMDVLRRLRAAGFPHRIMLLTLRDCAECRVEGLRAGADDCLARPFAFEELNARMQALCRRDHRSMIGPCVIGDLVINRGDRNVMRGGRPVPLSPRAYALLEYLALRAGQIVTRTEIEAHVYNGATEIMSNVVDRAVHMLRRRIQPPGTLPLLHTRRGIGYLLSADQTH